MPIKEEDVIKIDIKFHHTTCNHLKSKPEHCYFLMSLPVALHLILDTAQMFTVYHLKVPPILTCVGKERK